jgi:nicotinamidase/pyrazinamidase
MNALLIVDPNIDFFPGGALGAANAEKIIVPWNKMIAYAREKDWPIFISRDWHDPHMTVHFRKWPPHCVQGTKGAELHPALDTEGAIIISKGMDPDSDAYSPFEGYDAYGYVLAGVARHCLGITRFYFGGLVTEYCVRAAGIDGRKAGFKMDLLLDASCALEIKSGDEKSAIADMEAFGVHVTTTEQVIAEME